MSNAEQCKQIKELAEKLVGVAETTVDSGNADQINMTVPKEPILDFFAENGVDATAVNNFGKTAGNVTRAMHFAATEVNIKQVKEKVKKGEDYRNCSVHATAKLGRDIVINANVKAERRGQVKRPGGETVDYCKFNYGNGSMDIGAGLPTELVEHQAEQMQKAVKDSKFFAPIPDKK